MGQQWLGKMAIRGSLASKTGFLGVGIAIWLWASPAIARACQAVAPIPPSTELKEFRVHAFDLALAIPNNYRSMLRREGHITFHDPASFDLIQCLVRTGEYQEIPPYAALEVHAGVRSGTDLVEAIRVKRPWVDYYVPEFVPIRFGGRDALRYDYTNKIYGITISNISFLSDTGDTLLTLTGPATHPIMVNALVTLDLSPLLQD